MERAASLLTKLKSKNLAIEDLARAAWPAAVGKRLAERTRATHMVRQTLIVEVEDAMWRQQLNPLRFQILQNLAKILGSPSVTDVEFRIGVARRPPQRETGTATPAASSQDEAERIPDMVLRRIYKQSRTRAVGA
jgi:hypothetical protein